jgi:hypothetical protein
MATSALKNFEKAITKNDCLSSEQPPDREAVHIGMGVKLSVDQEQDAGNHGAYACDQADDVSAKVYA